MTDDAQMKTYLRRVRSSLQAPKAQRLRVLEEIEIHLEDGTAEYMRGGASRPQAVARAIAELGPPEAVAAGFRGQGPAVSHRTGLARWLPMLLPVVLLTVTVASLLSGLTWISGGLTVGERVALLSYARTATIAALLSYGAYQCIRRADVDPAWRWAAWACTGGAVMSFLIW